MQMVVPPADTADYRDACASDEASSLAPGLRPAALDGAREAVVRLGRAAQRAAIYPPEHPSVRLALGPFLDLVNGLVRDSGRLLVVVMKDRLVVSAGDQAPREQQNRWLASQLFARRITSLTFDAPIDVDDCLAFVQWLGQPAKESVDAPTATGLRLTRLDYSRAQFESTPRPKDETPAAIAAWNALAVRLAPGAVAGTPNGRNGDEASSSQAPIDPAHIASAIEADLAAAEGTGVASITGRLIQAGGGLATLPEAERQSVRERLAAVVASLPDEIRRQILAAIPRDNPGKIELLTEILDALPRERLLELVPRVDMTPGAHVRQFLAFLVKLVSLAHHDPAVSEALEAQVGRHGLPMELLHIDADGAQKLLDQLFTQTVEQFSSAGELYQATLQDLCTAQGAAETLDLSRYGDPQDRAAGSMHVARIALYALRNDARDATTPACLVRVRDAARRELEAGAIEVVADMAAVVMPIAGATLDAATHKLAQDCLAICRSPRAAERLMAALESQVGPASDALSALFLTSGLGAAALSLARLSELPDGPLRDRIGGLLARLELDVVRQAVTRACSDGMSVSRLLAVFRQLDPARTADLARVFVRDADPRVRREALEVLSDAPLAPVKRERVMLRALNDDDPGVVRVALRELSANQTPPGLAGLTTFLARTGGSEIEALQSYAVAALRQSWTPRAIEALAPALLARRRAFDPGARRVSRAIVATLEDVDDGLAQSAARAWRRSAAGVWSACRGDRAGAA
jgi:hypothetical protein